MLAKIAHNKECVIENGRHTVSSPVVIRLKLYIVIRFARKVCLLLMIGKLPVSCIRKQKELYTIKMSLQVNKMSSKPGKWN